MELTRADLFRIKGVITSMRVLAITLENSNWEHSAKCLRDDAASLQGIVNRHEENDRVVTQEQVIDHVLGHFLNDAPNLRCSACNCKAFGSKPGNACEILQPDGTRCQGIFR